MLRQKAAIPGKALKFGGGRSVNRPSPKKEAERCYPNTGLNALNELKPCPVTKPLSVVNGATFVLRTAAETSANR